MKVGMVGLGKMGSQMSMRLIKGGHECIGFDVDKENVRKASEQGTTPARDFSELIKPLPTPRVVWMMVPAGDVTEDVINDLAGRMSAGDILIDGGNSHYKDTVRRAGLLQRRKIHFVDVGTSGGTWGLARGYCLMIGGDKNDVALLDPIFKTLASGTRSLSEESRQSSNLRPVDLGYLHCGPVGSGHFVKMVHNGIEYGIMQSFAEGFDILKNSDSDGLPDDRRFSLDLAAIAEVWRHGSVVSSWLLDLAALSLAKDPELSNFVGFVHDSGEGRWTVQAALEEGVPAHVLSASLFARFRSRQEHTFGEKLLSALRNEFGGHIEDVPPGVS